MKKVLIILCLILALCTTNAFADYVDSSNRAHADGQNEIIQKAYVSNGHTVIVYIKNEKGIEDKLAFLKSNFSIPFVDIRSVKAEKKKYDRIKGQEVDSEYYNKIILEVTKSIHDKQRFVLINEFKDGDGENTDSNLMFSIAPFEKEVSDIKTTVEKNAQPAYAFEYNTITSAVATSNTKVKINFKDDIELDMDLLKDTSSYHLTAQDGTDLLVVRVYLTSSKQVILETAKQVKNERFALKIDWLDDTNSGVDYFYSNNSNNDRSSSSNSETTPSPTQATEPNLKKVTPTNSTTVILYFKDDVSGDTSFLEDPDNYTIEATRGPLEIMNAELKTDDRVILTTALQSPGVKYTVHADWIDAGDNKAIFRGSRTDNSSSIVSSSKVSVKRVKCTSANTVDVIFKSHVPEDQALDTSNYIIFNYEDENDQYDVLDASLSSDGQTVTLTVGPFTKFISARIEMRNFVKSRHGESSIATYPFYVYADYFK